MNVHFKAAVLAMPALNMSRMGSAHVCTPKSTWIGMWQAPHILNSTRHFKGSSGSRIKSSRIKHSIFHPSNICREQRQRYAISGNRIKGSSQPGNEGK